MPRADVAIRITAEQRELLQQLASASRGVERFTNKARRDLRTLARDGARSVSQFGRSVASTARRTAIVGAAIAAPFVAATAAIVGAVRSLDQLDKAAIRTGFNIEDLQILRLFGSRGGLTSEGLDSGLQRFSRRIGQAANDTGTLVPFLEQANINIRDMNGNIRGNLELLIEYGRFIASLPTTQERAAASFAAFDKEGVALGLTLAANVDTLEDFARRARELGLVIDEELVRKAAAANDQLTTLGDVLRTRYLAAVGQFAPQLGDLAGGIADTLSEYLQIDFGEVDQEAANEFIDRMIDNVEILAKGFVTLGETIAGVINQIATLFNLVGEGLERIGFLDGFEPFELIDLNQFIRGRVHIDRFFNTLRENVEANRQGRGGLANVRSAEELPEGDTQPVAMPFGTPKEIAQYYQNIQRAQLENAKDARETAARLAEKEKEAIEKRMEELARAQRDAADRLAESFAFNISQEVFNASSLKDAAVGVLRGIGRAIQEQAQATFFNQLRDIFSRLFRNLVNNISQDLAGNVGQSLGGFASRFFGVQTRHGGGPVIGQYPGQEQLVLAEVGERFYSRQQVAGGAGAGGTTINVPQTFIGDVGRAFSRAQRTQGFETANITASILREARVGGFA